MRIGGCQDRSVSGSEEKPPAEEEEMLSKANAVNGDDEDEEEEEEEEEEGLFKAAEYEENRVQVVAGFFGSVRRVHRVCIHESAQLRAVMR